MAENWESSPRERWPTSLQKSKKVQNLQNYWHFIAKAFQLQERVYVIFVLGSMRVDRFSPVTQNLIYRPTDNWSANQCQSISKYNLM